MTTPTLHGYARSSCTRRVQIALALKHIAFEFSPVDFEAGANRQADYLAKNPQGQVPVLEIDGHMLCQSVAILEYLEDTRPEIALLPATDFDRYRCRHIVEAINSGIQPLQNAAVLSRLSQVSGDDSLAPAWGGFWIDRGLAAVEVAVSASAGRYCIGDSVSLADVALAPQCFNAGLFELDLAAYPTVSRIYAACLELPEFAAALES